MKCYVPYCTNNNHGSTSEISHKSYHIIPKRNANVTEKWLKAIRRQNDGKYLNQRVCSDHFNKSDYYVAGNTRLLKKNAIPSIFSWPEMSVKEENNALKNALLEMQQVEEENAPKNVLEIQEIKQENIEMQQVEEENALRNAHFGMQGVEEENDLRNTLLEMQQQSIQEQLNLSKTLEGTVDSLNSENSKLKKELGKMQLKAEKMQAELQQYKEKMLLKTRESSTLRKTLRRKRTRQVYSISMVENNDKSMLFYTGLPNYSVFSFLLKTLLPSAEASSRFTISVRDDLRKKNRSTLTVEDQLFMVLIMLHRGTGIQMASDMFGISKSTCHRIFSSWIDHMCVTLGSQNVWPHRDVLINSASKELKEQHPNLLGSIDCAEFFIQNKPSLKSLIMTSPNGCIIFMSPLMTGSMSDKDIVVAGGFLDTINSKLASGDLLPEDTVLADKDVKIHDLTEDASIQINIPTFRISGFQFINDDVLAARKIAKEKIYVGTTIKRLRSFKILSSVIPVTLMGSLNQIYIVCCLLTNFMSCTHPLK